MAIGSLLVFLALLVLVALFVARPLLAEADEDSAITSEASHWLAERERVLDALTELDADWAMGKVPGDIYAEQRKLLLAKGALALEQLDKEVPVPRKSKQKKAKKEAGDDLEELIAAYKAKKGKRK